MRALARLFGTRLWTFDARLRPLAWLLWLRSLDARLLLWLGPLDSRLRLGAFNARLGLRPLRARLWPLGLSWLRLWTFHTWLLLRSLHARLWLRPFDLRLRSIRCAGV